MMSSRMILIHPTFYSRTKMVLLNDYGSQSFITVPLSKTIDERKEPELLTYIKETSNIIYEKSFITVH